jgi:hypothetical protein
VATAGGRNRLDVYRRRGRPPDGPTLVSFHGGGDFSGDKNREGRALLHRLAGRGWLCVSANHRLRPAVTFPDHLTDAKRAIAWSSPGGSTRSTCCAGPLRGRGGRRGGVRRPGLGARAPAARR